MSTVRSDNCPHCGTSLLGNPIPTESRKYYGDQTHFSRTIGINVQGVYDGVLFWCCPDCGKAWQRWDDDSRLARLSARYVDEHNARTEEVR